MKKLLLLTGIPPCKEFTAGLVLDQLCRFMPVDSLACFAVVNPALKATISPDLAGISIEYARKPQEDGGRILPDRWGGFSSLAVETCNALFAINRIARNAIAFGRKNKVGAVWCVLEGQTLIRLARRVAHGLGVPLLVQVWDPPYWWLREHRVDRLSRSLILKEFSLAIRESVCCAAASWAMAEAYQRDYGAPAVPVIPSLEPDRAKPPATALHAGDKLVIGLAGQLYSVQEWLALTAALDSVEWNVAGREVTIRLLGRNVQLRANGKQRIEFLGWRSQEDTIQLMSEADILYCPYWFDPVFENEARLSFPAKLTTFLAAGRPVLFHGPTYALPGKFLTDNNAGTCCNSLEKQHILEAIVSLIDDEERYGMLAHNGSSAFRKYLTLDTMERNFKLFLGHAG